MAPDEGRTPLAPRRPTLNNWTLFVLGVMNMVDCININLLVPYVVRMVSDFTGLQPSDPHVVRTVGLLIGLYSLAEVIFSPLWGALSDRLGRKPTLMIGLGGSVIAPILFGLAKDLPTVFIARALDGMFCGNMGVTRTYLGEIVDSSNEARGFSFLSTCFSAGLFIGPVLGGQLVFPASWAPSVFGGTIFDEYPFLLPNLTYALLAMAAWVIGFFFLEETLPKSQRLPLLSRRRREQARDVQDVEPQAAPTPAASARRTLFQVLVAYCLMSTFTCAGSQLFIMIFSFEHSVHGVGLSTSEIGLLNNVCAVALLCNQLFLYSRIVGRLGMLRCWLLGWFILVSVQLAYPLAGLAWAQKGAVRLLPLGVLKICEALAGGLLFPVVFTFINRASEGMPRGAINGWANSSSALCRALAPPIAACLLSAGRRLESTSGPQLHLGRYLPVYLNVVLCTAGMLAALPGVRKVSLLRAITPQAPSGEGIRATASAAPADNGAVAGVSSAKDAAFPLTEGAAAAVAGDSTGAAGG